MFNWKRLLQLKGFDEDSDLIAGTGVSRILFLCAAAIGYIAIPVTIIAYLAGVVQLAQYGAGTFISAFAVMSGFAWHLGMKGRAKNGVLLALLFAALWVALF